MIVKSPTSVLFTEVGVNHSWSSLGGPIVVNSTDVIDFYPSRINLEYATDKKGNVTLYKNRVWSSYLSPTKIENHIPEETDVSESELKKGVVPVVKKFNEYVLDEVSKFSEVRNPDKLTKENFTESMDYLMEAINDRQTYIKFSQSNRMGNDNVIINKVTKELELLGSIYILYAAKRRILRKE